jgi:hypothetical protein
MLDGTEAFLDAFVQGSIVFLAGSGICFHAGVPSADEILKHTARIFMEIRRPGALPPKIRKLANSNKLQTEIFSPSPPGISIQPEVLYEKLLLLSDDDPKILGLWETLCFSEWENPPHPTLTHRAVVAYSLKNHAPILTTNFDALFEMAPEAQNVDLLVPPTITLEKLNAPIDTGHVRIVKLHGTIGNRGCDTSNIQTTMTSISVTNFDVLSYLGTLLEQKSIAIVGYSGRDLDLFPAIRNLSFHVKNGNSIFWLDHFDNEPTKSNFESLATRIMVRAYPDEVFLRNHDRLSLSQYVYEPKDNFTCLHNRAPVAERETSENRKEKILANKAKALSRNFAWNDSKKLLFIGFLYSCVGKYIEAYSILKFLRNKPSMYRGLVARDRANLLYELCNTAHNNSRFREHAHFASQLLTLSEHNSSLLLYQLLGKSLLAESERMAIPFDTFLGRDLGARLFREDLFRAYDLTARIEREIKLMIKSKILGVGFELNEKTLTNALGVATQHELVEFEIRKYAILQAIFKEFWEDPKRSPDVSLATHFAQRWLEIERKSRSVGYAAGIINAYKYLSRINVAAGYGETLTEGERLANLLSRSTTRQLLYRNRVERDLLAGIPMKQKIRVKHTKLLLQIYKESSNSGNRLNAIKALLGIGELNRICDPDLRFNEIFTVENHNLLPDIGRMVARLGLPRWRRLWRKFPQLLRTDDKHGL